MKIPKYRNSISYYKFIICFRIVISQALIPDVSWDFTNVKDRTVLAEEKISNNNEDTTRIVTSRNSGELLQGTTVIWDEILKNQVAFFNGVSSGVVIQNLTGLCVLQPESCKEGFSAAFWLKWDKYESNLIFTSASFGMNQFVPETAPVEVTDTESGKSWRVFVPFDATYKNWQFVTMTWSANLGLKFYIDGVLKESSSTFQEANNLATVNSNLAQNRLAFGTTVAGKSELNVKIYFNKFMIWERDLKSSEVEQIYKNGN